MRKVGESLISKGPLVMYERTIHHYFVEEGDGKVSVRCDETRSFFWNGSEFIQCRLLLAARVGFPSTEVSLCLSFTKVEPILNVYRSLQGKG